MGLCQAPNLSSSSSSSWLLCREAGGVEGIVNGMDVDEWSPMKDKFLDVKFDAKTVKEGKALAKETLQAELGLPVRVLLLLPVMQSWLQHHSWDRKYALLARGTAYFLMLVQD